MQLVVLFCAVSAALSTQSPVNVGVATYLSDYPEAKCLGKSNVFALFYAYYG